MDKVKSSTAPSGATRGAGASVGGSSISAATAPAHAKPQGNSGFNIETGPSSQQARDIAKIRAEYELKLQAAKQQAKESVEKSLQDGKSELYRDIEQRIREELGAKQAAKDAELARSKEALEKKFLVNYEDKFLSMEGRFDTKFKEMVAEMEGLLKEAQHKWEADWDRDLHTSSVEWAKKWADREQEWVRVEREKEAHRLEQHRKFTRQYQTVIEEHLQKIEAMLASRPDGSDASDATVATSKDVAGLDEKIAALQVARTALMQNAEDVEGKVTERFGEVLKSLQDTHATSLASLEASSQAQQRELKALVDKEKEAHQQTYAKLTQEHEEHIRELNQAIAKERQDLARSQMKFEASLREQYESLATSLRKEVASNQEAQLRQAMEALQKQALEEARRTREALETESSAEKIASEKFRGMIEELHATWQEEEKRRAHQLEERMRGHYEAVVEHLQHQLDAALSLHDEADKQWAEDMQARNERQLETLRAFEEKCRLLYEDRLKQFVDKSDAELAQYETKLFQAGESMAKMELESTRKLRRMKVACAKWRADYLKDSEAQFEQTVATIEQAHEEQVTSLNEQLAQALAKLNHLADQAQAQAPMHELGQGQRHILAEELPPAKSPRAQTLGLGRRTGALNGRASTPVKSPTTGEMQQREALRGKYRDLHAQLRKLWEGLHTSDAEKVSALEKFLEAGEPTQALIAAYEKYNRTLADQLPLVQTAARREYLKARMKTLRRVAQGMRSGAGRVSARELAELKISNYRDLEAQLELHSQEIVTIEEDLTREIKHFNARNNTTFTFRGKDYLRLLNADRNAQSPASDIANGQRQL